MGVGSSFIYTIELTAIMEQHNSGSELWFMTRGLLWACNPEVQANNVGGCFEFYPAVNMSGGGLLSRLDSSLAGKIPKSGRETHDRRARNAPCLDCWFRSGVGCQASAIRVGWSIQLVITQACPLQQDILLLKEAVRWLYNMTDFVNINNARLAYRLCGPDSAPLIITLHGGRGMGTGNVPKTPSRTAS